MLATVLRLREKVTLSGGWPASVERFCGGVVRSIV